MPTPLYELYANAYKGESLLEESNFTQRLKNKVFVDNFKKNLQGKLGMTPEAIGTYFSSIQTTTPEPSKGEFVNSAQQPEIPLSGRTQSIDPNNEGLGTQAPEQVIDPQKDQSLTTATPNAVQDTSATSAYDTQNFYAEDLVRLVDHVGLTQKYPASMIRANSTDSIFMNKVVKELEQFPFIEKQLKSIQGEKGYIERSLFKQFYGIDPAQTSLKGPDVKSLVEQGQGIEKAVKNRFVDGALKSFDDKVEAYTVLLNQSKLIDKDSKEARRYFAEVIEPDKRINPIYKLNLKRQLGAYSSETTTIQGSDIPQMNLESQFEKQDKIAWNNERMAKNGKEYNDALLTYKDKLKVSRDLTYFELQKAKDEYVQNIDPKFKKLANETHLYGNPDLRYPARTRTDLEKDFNISSTEDLLKSLDKLIAQTETNAVFVDRVDQLGNSIGFDDSKQIPIDSKLKAGRFTLGVTDAHLPLYDAKISLVMLNILSKQDKGEDLRPDEENMLKAYAILTDAGQNLDRTFSFSIGQGVPNNLIFMASLAASSGIMGGVEKTVEGVSKKLLLQQAQGRIAGSIGKKLATNLAGWAPQLLGNIAGNIAITPLQPMFTDLYMKKRLGTVDLKGELDPTNLQVDTSRKDRMNGFQAATGAFRETLVENLSESSGFIFDKGINKILKNPIARKIMGTKNDFALAKTARVNGMISEVLEEYVATAMNAPFETWQTTKDQLTMRSFAEIVVGTAIFTVPFGGFSAYQLHNRKKEINTAGEKLASTIGNEKFAELQTILKLPTLEQRKIALEEFSKQNKITGDQYLSLIKYGALKTVFDVQEGFLKEKEVPTKLSNQQRDIRKIIRSERTSALESMAQKLAPDEFKAISDARDAGITDATKDNATVQNEYKLALGTLLRSDKLVSETNKINQQFAKQIHDNTHAPENKLSTTYSVQSEFDQAISKVRKTSRAEAAESTKGKDINDIFKMTQEVQGRVSSFENRDKRITEIDKELETAKTTKKNRLLRERTNLLSMSQEDYIKDTHKLEYFNERKQSLQNIQSVEDSRNIRNRFDDEMVYTDSEGNKKRLDRSPDLAEFNIIHDQVMASAAELRRMDAELSTPMPDKFKGKNEGLIWQEQRTADRAKYATLLAETNRLKSEAETKFTEIHGPVNKGQQIAKTSTEELKQGQKVILEDAISGAAMNAEILTEGIEQNSGKRYAIVQFQNKDGKKYQLTYVPDENSDYRLYESKDHESVNSRDTRDYYAGNPENKVFKQPAMLERWKQSIRNSPYGKGVYSFKTKQEAEAKRGEFVRTWGVNMISDVFENEDTGNFGIRMQRATVETPDQRVTRIEQESLQKYKMGIMDYLQEMKDFYGHMSENELKTQEFASENGDAKYFSYDQWLDDKIGQLINAMVLSHESLDGQEDMTLSEMELIDRQAKVTKATNHLVSMTKTPIAFVDEDTERKKSGGKQRKGWQEKDVYVVNLELATLDTPIHEYAHPIFDAIESENKPLFDKLYAELESTEEGRTIIQTVKKDYSHRSDQYQKKEALVTAVGKLGVEFNKYDLSPFARVLYKIRTVLNNWLQKVTRQKLIKDTTTLGELAEMIVKGQIKQGDISLVKSTEQHESQAPRKLPSNQPSTPREEILDYFKNGGTFNKEEFLSVTGISESKDTRKTINGDKRKKSDEFHNVSWALSDNGPKMELFYEGSSTEYMYDNIDSSELQQLIIETINDISSELGNAKTLPEKRRIASTTAMIMLHKMQFPEEYDNQSASTADMLDFYARQGKYLDENAPTIPIGSAVQQNLFNEPKLSPKESIISAVKEGQPFWIQYQNKEMQEKGEPGTWRKVNMATLAYNNSTIVVTEGTGFSALDKAEKGVPATANIRIDDQRLQGFSLTEPVIETTPTETPTVEQLQKGVDFIFEQNPELSNIGTEKEYSEYLETIFPNSQVKKITYHIGRVKESFDKSAIGSGEGSLVLGRGFYFGNDLGSIAMQVGFEEQAIESNGEILKLLKLLGSNLKISILNIENPYFEKGDLRWGNVSGDEVKIREITKLNDGIISDGEIVVFEPEQIHILGSQQDLEGFKKFKQSQSPTVIETPKLYVSPTNKSNEAWKKIMLVAGNKYNQLINDAASELSKSEKIREATKAALIAYSESEYYKTLITSDERKIDNQILSNLIQKMLRKQKSIIDEAGLQSMVEAIDGVASTTEDRMKQFENGFTPILNSLATTLGMSPVKLKIEFLDMFKKENIVYTKKDFLKIVDTYTSELQKRIAKALVESPMVDFDKYVSMANFFGSIHIEDQYGIRITDGIAQIYNQVTSISEKNLRADFMTYNARMSDPKNVAKIQTAIDAYQQWSRDEYKRTSKIPGDIPLTQESLTEFVKVMTAVTGLEQSVISEYLNNPKATEGLFIKENNVLVPVNGRTFNELVGTVIYLKDGRVINSPAMISALMTTIHRVNGAKSLQSIIKNHMLYAKGKSSNLDFIVESFTRNEQSGTEGLDVEGNRFQTFSLNHHLYQAALTLDKTIKDPFLSSYYKKTPMRLSKFDGIKNMDTDKSFSGTKIDQESLWFGMLMSYNVSGSEYQQFLGQFSDKTTVYTGNALKRVESTDYIKAKEVNPNIDKDITYIFDIIKRNYTQFGIAAHESERMDELAKNFVVSFALNLDAIGTVIHGSDFISSTGKQQYKGLDDLIKRSQVTISPGYNYMVNVEGGVADKIRYVIVDDYIMRDLRNMGIEQLDGENIASEAYMKAAQISSGSILARSKDFPTFDAIKGAISYVNEFGERILIKSLITNINTHANTFADVTIYEKLKNYMAIHNIDVLSFPSSAKKFGSHPTTSLFFNTMMPVSEVKNTEKTWNVTDLLNGLNLVGLQKQGEDQVTLYEKERDEEMQRGIPFQDTKAYQKLKQNLLMRLSTSELLKSGIREELALANKEGKQYLFYDNQQYGNDVMAAFNEVLEEAFQKAEINESPYNKPKVLSIPRENFFIQQDLRHEKSPHAQDISTQMYTNFVTLPRYGEFIKNLTDANKMQYMFNKKFFNGFRDKEILREYLLLNINKAEDPDMYAMVDAWAINDPTFSNKVSTKLVNILKRDILEVNISRQSSYEIADLTGKLKGLRKVMDSEGVERSLLPEIAVNIPGIRYGKEFKTREEAVNFMNDNKNTLVDLQNEDFSLQFWQLYKDGNKWIVPGEPVISSRTPAGNLNCHTVARARYKINASSAVTMLDINSRRKSGSDFDGDARYNWTLSKSKGVTLLDNTYQGKINKALMSAVKDYEDVQNFEKITTPIDTEAFDDIIKSLGIKESTNTTFRSLKDQEKFRSRNMTGYNMKGIMSNLTTAFSYLNYFETPGIVRDEYNMVKVALDNLLNLCFDNAKDPKIEKLGLNESTAAMFIYELITDSSIDQATTAQEAKDAVAAVMNRLVDKYSDYSYLLQDKMVYQYLSLLNEDKKSLFSKPDPVMTRMKEANVVGEKVSDEFEQFSKNYYLGKDLEAFGKIKSLRDGIPHKMSLFLIARANMDEFIQGKDKPRFYDGRHIPNLDGQKPALSAIYKTMELGENVFANLPGYKFINGLISIINNSYNTGRLSVYDKAKNVTNIVSDEVSEVNPLVTMRHLPYLTGLRNGRSFKETSKFIVSKLEEYQRIQEMTLEEQQTAGFTPAQTATNEFLETLVYFPKDGYYSIRIAPSTSNTKLSAEYTQRLKNSFDLLDKEMQDALAYNSLVAFGFNEGIKGGGYFGLISAETRIRMAGQATTDFNDFVFSALQQRIVDSVTAYGEMKGKNSVSSVKVELSAIPNINSILIEEQLNLEQLPNAPKATVDTYLKQLLGETVENPVPIERIAAKQENLGLKSKDEFIVLLKKLQNAYKNVKHQLDNTNDFTEVALQNSEVFEYMFKHFKSVYPELKVFNDALEFAAFVESQTKNGDFNLSAIGAAFANAVYLSNNARQDTFFHEVAHIYWDALDAKDSSKMALRSLYGYKESMSKKEKDAIEEKIIEDIGKIGTDRTLLRFKGDRLQLFLSYLEQFWARVKSVFGLTAKSRNEAKMFFLNNVMADRIWNNGVSVPQVAIDAIVRHQISKTDYDSDIVNGRDISSSESWLRSQQLHANNLEQQLSDAYDKFNSERNNIPEKSIDRNPFNGDYVSVDSAGRVFLKDRDGDIVGHAINPNEITREKFQEAQLTTINRERVLNQAVRAMVAGSATIGGIDNFNIDGDQFEFDEYFENPVEAYKEIKKIVDDLKTQFDQNETGTPAKFVLTPALFDDVADHVTHVDAMGIDDQGNTTIVRIVPTFVSLNKDSVESSEYTEQTGAFTKGSPLNGLPTSKKEEIRLEMVQFATMLGKDKVKMITIPILLKRNEAGKVEQIERETQTVFDFTPEDKILGETILTHIRTEKAPNKSFNLNNLFTALKATVNESKAVRMTIDAIKSLQRLTGSLSTSLPTHNVLLSAKLGYGKILDRITKYGWDVNQFFFEPNVNIVQETRKFTSKIPLKSDGSGQLIYGSPGWGKKLASGLSSDFIDSSYLLERILFTDDSNARLLTAKSPVIETLDEYSRYHELVDELEDGTTKKLTWATLISDYHNEHWTKELFAYKVSLLIDQLRKVAIKELIATGYHDNLKTINPNDIIAIRQALSGKTGEAVDIINITTPYEELKTSVEQNLASGKHVLTSTLVSKKHAYLFDMQYDKAFRLVKDINDTGANEDENSITGPLGMHERSTSGQYVTSLNYQNQKWIKRRFKTEIERFSGKSYVSYTEGFATDDLFKEPLSSQDGKITDMKVAFYIDHFKIKRSDFDKEFKNNSDLTVTEYVLNKARKYYTSTTMQFNEKGYVEGSAKKVYDTILSEEVQQLVDKNLSVHKALGLRNAPVTDAEYYDAVQLYNKNKTIAENIWKNFGSFGGFISMYDNSSHLTDTEKGVNKRKLAQIFKQVSGLDFINREGLYEVVGNQIATNYVLEQVAKEASEEQRSFGYRMYTVLLNKMLTDPSFKWMDSERKWEWLGFDFTPMIQKMGDYVLNFKLDRSIDIKHTLGQTLALTRMENDHNIKDDVAKVGSKLNELYAKMTDEDKQNIIYAYGSKGAVKDSQGRLIYAGDKYKRSFGRYAYIPVNEAIEMVSQGTMSTHAYEYLNLVRSNMMKYDQAYANQQQRTNYAAPTFVPDFIAQKETGRLKNQVANHSEFVKAVLDSYKIDISNDRTFIDQLYKALDTSKEGGYLLTGLKNLDNDNLVIYEDLTLSQTKRMMFEPETVISEATDNNIPIREVLANKIKDFETLRFEANKNAISRYVETERAFKVHGAHSKGIILRTQKFNEATQMYLNSLILNYHTTAVTPFAFMVEDIQKQYAEGSPIMAKWSTKYIDANFFKFQNKSSEKVQDFWRMTGLYMTINSLGFNVTSGIGNFTAGQLQTFFLHRKGYSNAVKRVFQLPKVIALMHHNHIGMVLEDLDLKESAKTIEKISKVTLVITEHVENVNQGMGFLSQMTDEELAAYDENGLLIPGKVPMSMFRIFQIEAKIREINGDYGKNRALYRTNPFLMEWGRFSMGWWQAMIQTHFAPHYVDIWGEEHISIGEAWSNTFQKLAFNMSQRWFGLRSRDAISKKAFASVMKNRSLDKMVSDTEQEAIKKVTENTNVTVPTKVFSVEIGGKTKFIAINEYDQLSLWGAMSYEMLSDLNGRDYSRLNDKEKEQIYRSIWEVTTAGFFVTSSALLMFTLSGLASGAGDPKNKGEVDLWLAFLDGYHHYGFWNIFKPWGKPIIPLDPLTQYSSLNKEVWKYKYTLEMLNNYSTRTLADIMVPYDPTAWSKRGVWDKVPIVKKGLDLFDFVKQFSNINENFDYISEKQGFTDQTNKLMYYGRKLLPVSPLVRSIYQLNFMDKAHLEESQVSILAKRDYINTYKLSYGAKNIKPDFSDPKVKKELAGRIKKIGSLYYSNQEFAKHKGTQRLNEINSIGTKNIKESLGDAEIDINLIRETSNKYKKR